MPTRTSRSAILLLLVGSGIAALACGSQPIPLAAVEGTTITIAVPGSFNTGFGRALYGGTDPPLPAQLSSPPPYVPTSPLEDVQRGELVFNLYDDTNFVANLPLRYITKVSPNPSSRSEIDGYVVRTKAQTIAFLDLPLVITESEGTPEELQEGWYRIVVTRYRRKKNNPDLYEVAPVQNVNTPPVPWHGWGDDSVAEYTASSPHEIPIFIQKSATETTRFTPIKGWERSTNGLQWEGATIEAALEELVPYPDFELRVPAIGSSETPPAAWTIELGYVKGTIRVRGVSLRRSPASGAIVLWDADDDPEAQVECYETGVLKIQVMDPERLTEGVRVAYDLRNFDTPCASRASATSFNAVQGSFQAWDEDGVDITASYGSPGFGIDATGFF